MLILIDPPWGGGVNLLMNEVNLQIRKVVGDAWRDPLAHSRLTGELSNKKCAWRDSNARPIP